MYAHIVLGLPVEGPFDYEVPVALQPRLRVGMKVEVGFGKGKAIGFVVGLSKTTQIKKLKPVLRLLDPLPVLTPALLKLTKELSEHYCCSWGQAIETALPEKIRNAKTIIHTAEMGHADLEASGTGTSQATLEVLVSSGYVQRWGIYAERIKEVRKKGASAIVVVSDVPAVHRAAAFLNAALEEPVDTLYRDNPAEASVWDSLRKGKRGVAVGTRSAVFAPYRNPGLLIIDEEDDPVYKQDQVPHYHARDVAVLRSHIEGIPVILSSATPSLETYYALNSGHAQRVDVSCDQPNPAITVVDTRSIPRILRKRGQLFSTYIHEAVRAALEEKGKVLFFLNRTGFATSASCPQCGYVARCPRCSLSLVYHFKQKELVCHCCGYATAAPTICPGCNVSYLRYSGVGTEKIESELARLFPQARIARFDPDASPDADILIATQSIVKQAQGSFSVVAVLGIDSQLNRLDFRSAEKTFAILSKLKNMAQKTMLIETQLPNHHCFRALASGADCFYQEELEQRKQLQFPPFAHLAVIKLRGRVQEKARAAGSAVFQSLREAVATQGFEVLSFSPAEPFQKRGNYYYHIVLRGPDAVALSSFLKVFLKERKHSGIIITVDIDPV